MSNPAIKTRSGCRYDLYQVYVRPGHCVYKIVCSRSGLVAHACTTAHRGYDLFDIFNRCPADKSCGETCYDQ